MAEPEEEAPPILLPCSICSRTFKPESLNKHSKVCEKNATKKRKTFDSSKQRIQGTELAEFLPSLLLAKKSEKVVTKKTQSKWKEKHLEFVRAIRVARGVEDASHKTTSATTVFKQSNHERCPHCDRNFGPKAFDRHIEWCKEQKARIPKSPASNQAKERLEARIKYRAPTLGKSKRTLTREKYAPHDLSPIGRRTSASASGLLSTQHQPPVTPAMPSIRGTGTKSQGHRTAAKESVSSPACSMQRATLSRASVRQRSASPVKRVSVSSPSIKGNIGKGEPVRVKSDTSEEKDQDDLFSSSCNITRLQLSGSSHRVFRGRKPENQQHSSSEESYDPYLSAERQMLELLSHGDCRRDPRQPSRPILRSAPISMNTNSACVEAHPKSAFARYTATKPQSECDSSGSTLSELEDLFISGHSRNSLPSPNSLINFENNNIQDIPISLTSFGLNIANNNMLPGQRKISKIRAKMENAALSLQQSVSVCNYENGQVNMSTETNENGIIHTENKSNFPPPFSKKYTSFSSPDLKPSMPSSSSLQLDDEDETGMRSKDENRTCNTAMTSEDEELSAVNNRRSIGSKFSADSAYSSLNRRSPHSHTADVGSQGQENDDAGALDMDQCHLMSSSSSESSLPPLCTVQVVRCESKSPSLTPTPPPAIPISPDDLVLPKMPKFCHECGSKYPVSLAKFCCECGIRRLII